MAKAKKELDTRGMDTPPPVSVVMTADTTAEDLAVMPARQSEAERKAYFDELAFMEEFIEFTIHASNDKNEEPIVECGNNGIRRAYKRGERYRDRRKFVDSLISKVYRVDTPEITQADGERMTITRKIASDMYPISVFNDTPRGEAWLRNRMANP